MFAILIFILSKERKISAQIFENILKSLIESQINTFVSYLNNDPGTTEIIKIIKNTRIQITLYFTKTNLENIFLSIYKNSSFIIGSTSSGILESASIPIPSINVGYRQTEEKQIKM